MKTKDVLKFARMVILEELAVKFVWLLLIRGGGFLPGVKASDKAIFDQ